MTAGQPSAWRTSARTDFVERPLRTCAASWSVIASWSRPISTASPYRKCRAEAQPGRRRVVTSTRSGTSVSKVEEVFNRCRLGHEVIVVEDDDPVLGPLLEILSEELRKWTCQSLGGVANAKALAHPFAGAWQYRCDGVRESSGKGPHVRRHRGSPVPRDVHAPLNPFSGERRFPVTRRSRNEYHLRGARVEKCGQPRPTDVAPEERFQDDVLDFRHGYVLASRGA
jgi:hypothetical protein